MILKAGPFRQNVDYQMLISDDTLLALGTQLGKGFEFCLIKVLVDITRVLQRGRFKENGGHF